MKKFLKVLLWLIVAAALALAVFVGSGYAWSLRDRASVSIPGLAVLQPDGTIPLGGALRAEIRVPLPLYRRVVKTEVKPGAGVTFAGTPKTSSSFGWSKRIWTVSVELRPYRTGSIPPGVAAIEISPVKGSKAPEVFEAAIPGFTVKAPAAGTLAHGLELAGAVEEKSVSTRSRLWWLLLLPVAALALWYVLRRRRVGSAPPEPLWKRTLTALGSLRDALKGEKLPVEGGFTKLTDIVRGYLEQRYQLPATRETTPEFLSGIDRNNPLPEEQRPFLRDFLTAADLIKFAKAPADFARIDHAIASAEALVESTREPEEGGTPHA